MNNDKQQSVSPTTTSEQDLRTASQRRVNLIWETTQALLAFLVTAVTLYTAASLVQRQTGVDITGGGNAPFLLLGNAFFLVIGFYFGRTNHARIGDKGSGGTNALDDRR